MDAFTSRKEEHIRWSLDEKSQAIGLSDLDQVKLIPEALPDVNFEDVQIQTEIFGKKLNSPIFISSMTAGHGKSLEINRQLVRAANSRGWMMGVGSQRRELNQPEAANEWKIIRRESPDAVLMGNIGIAELIELSADRLLRLADNLQAQGFFIHLNALQEVLQMEGNPQFKGGLQAIAQAVKTLKVPVVVKEVGCGMSVSTMKKIAETGVAAIDISGLGGTQWGRIEGLRAPVGHWKAQVAETFKDWGQSSVQSLIQAQGEALSCPLWASGGVRSGLDAAKLLNLGAQMVGVAKPMLEAVLQVVEEGQETALDQVMERFERELKTALFCTGFSDMEAFRKVRSWEWKK